MAPSPTSPKTEPDGKRFDAFISYSHEADHQIAIALQRELQRFAKPWYRIRSASVFRDETNLGVSPNLLETIKEHLDDSAFFVLLASTSSARSKWVKRELCHWLTCGATDDQEKMEQSGVSHQRAERFIIVLTDGEICWDTRTGDFDWNTTTSLPDALRGVFRDEPLWIDVRWAAGKDEALLGRESRAFMQSVAKVSSALRNLDIQMLVGQDYAEHRRTMRTAKATVSVLGVLLIATGAAAYLATYQRRVALRNFELAQSRYLQSVETLEQLTAILESKSSPTERKNTPTKSSGTPPKSKTTVSSRLTSSGDTADVVRAAKNVVLGTYGKLEAGGVEGEADTEPELRKKFRFFIDAGDAEGKSGNLELAKQEYVNARNTATKLYRRDANNAWYSYYIAGSSYRLAIILERAHKVADARRICEAAMPSVTRLNKSTSENGPPALEREKITGLLMSKLDELKANTAPGH